MPDFIHNDFLSRLIVASDGRDIWPWLHGLGLSSGVVQGMVNRGVIPSGYTCVTLQYLENINTSWLLTGNGDPYLVDHSLDDEECLAKVTASLASAEWTLTIATDGLHNALLLTRETAFSVKDKPPRRYTELRILTNAGPNTLTAAVEDRSGLHFLPLAEDQFQSLVKGRLGTYRLLGDTKTPGLMANAKPIRDSRFAAIAETAARYGRRRPESGLAPDEATLLETYRWMSVADRTRLQAIAEALAGLSEPAEEPQEQA